MSCGVGKTGREDTHTGASISCGWSLPRSSVRSIRLVMAASRTLQGRGDEDWLPSSCALSPGGFQGLDWHFALGGKVYGTAQAAGPHSRNV